MVRAAEVRAFLETGATRVGAAMAFPDGDAACN
jgi:hypothetical protein